MAYIIVEDVSYGTVRTSPVRYDNFKIACQDIANKNQRVIDEEWFNVINSDEELIPGQKPSMFKNSK